MMFDIIFLMDVEIIKSVMGGSGKYFDDSKESTTQHSQYLRVLITCGLG